MKMIMTSDLRNVEPVEEGLFAAEAPNGWAQAAKKASETVSGMVFPRAEGMTHIRGSKRIYYVNREIVQPIIDAKAIACAIGIIASWSVGSVAYGLLKWASERQIPERNAVKLVSETKYGYQDCLPGLYPSAVQYDVSSYYYTLWARLPSVRCHVARGRLIFQKPAANEVAKWQDILAAVKSHKLLRNALVGAAMGRSDGTRYYFRGERREWKGSAGPFRNAASLVVRSGWEVSRRVSADTGSHYTNVDCVIMDREAPKPTLWERLGFTVRTEAEGEAEVCAPGIYRVGAKQTGWYSRGSRFVDTFPREPEPEREYYREWL